jgi:hypothetical protein
LRPLHARPDVGHDQAKYQRHGRLELGLDLRQHGRRGYVIIIITITTTVIVDILLLIHVVVIVIITLREGHSQAEETQTIQRDPRRFTDLGDGHIADVRLRHLHRSGGVYSLERSRGERRREIRAFGVVQVKNLRKKIIKNIENDII